jgi:hypothetical protein
MESKEDTGNNNTLALSPVQYSPSFNGTNYVDDLELPKYALNIIKTHGIVCDCPSNNIFKNGYSFKTQHCNGTRHKKYIEFLNDSAVGIIEEYKEQCNEIRDLKVESARMRNECHRKDRENTEQNNIILELNEKILNLRRENDVLGNDTKESIDLLQQLKNENDDIGEERDEIKRKYTLLTETIKTYFTNEECLQFP